MQQNENRKSGATPGQIAKSVIRTAGRAKRSVNNSARRSGRGSSYVGSRSSYNPTQRSSGGGGGGGSFSSAPKISIPSLAAYLGTDSAYQSAVSGGKRTLADYISELSRRRGEATTQFNTTKASMERDRATQADQLRQEFASRGLINSGLFGQKEGEFQQQYNDQFNALNQQQSGLLADLMSQQHNYQREYELALQQAKQEALARRAAKYNIG